MIHSLHRLRAEWAPSIPRELLGLALIYGLPLLPWRGLTLIPPPLICVVALTLLGSTLGLPLATVADLGQLPEALPSFALPGVPASLETLRIIALPGVPASLETLRIIALPALAIAMVGLLESVLTARVVDEMTETPSDKNRECSGLGLANVSASLFGGIAGCGMIGQAVGNVKYGGRGRLSTLFAGLFLLLLMVLLKPWVSQVPVMALVAIMVMVSVETFDWKSLRALVVHPRSSSAVMLATVVVTVATHNLAAGVGVGVVLSGVLFAVKVSRLLEVSAEDDEATGLRTWRVSGQVFFASADAFLEAFDILDVEQRPVRLDVSRAHFWDITAVAALDQLVERLRHHGCAVEVVGLNEASAVLIDRLGARAGEPG
jgi:sulfate permease, SulP family